MDKGVPAASTLNKKGNWLGNFTAKRKDGSTFIAYGPASSILDSNKKLIGYSSSVYDITKEKEAEEKVKESEEKYRTIAETIPGAVYNCDAREEHSSCIHKQSGSGRLLHSIGFVGCLYNSGGQITNAFAGKSQRRKSV